MVCTLYMRYDKIAILDIAKLKIHELEWTWKLQHQSKYTIALHNTASPACFFEKNPISSSKKSFYDYVFRDKWYFN